MPIYGQSLRLAAMIILWLACVSTNVVQAQTDTNSILASPGQAAVDSTNAAPILSAATNSIPSNPAVPAVTPPLPAASSSSQNTNPSAIPSDVSGWIILSALMTFGSIGGFLLYLNGLTRAKNCGHTSTLLLVGVIFALIGYWMGGFAVQTGGVGNDHAALAAAIPPAEARALDHELGPIAMGHHWGLMGSSGFFLITEPGLNNGIAALFLSQAAFLVIALAAAFGASLERARLTAMAIGAFLIGALVYPLLANWVWGGGWLAELGREYGLGHGFIDLAGSGVVHETAGTLALVIAMVLGPRYSRFGRDKISHAIPGHNLPFVILGAVILLISWSAANAFSTSAATTGLAATNTLLAAMGGLVISFFLAAGQKRRPEPALLCRGLLGGAIASCACSGLIDPWAAFVIGIVAGLLVQLGIHILEKQRIDDPVGATAVHGLGGAWGVIATGIFANGTAGNGLNGIDGPVRGLLFGGSWHQLAAQAIGCVTGFVVIFILGYACLTLIQKIVGTRVDLVDETGGLDWTQVGALGYQGDVDLDDTPRKS